MGETPPNDLHCARCGYALKGLDPAGSCPECNLSINETIRLLRLPWRNELKRIALGSLIALIASAALFTWSLLFEHMRIGGIFGPSSFLSSIYWVIIACYPALGIAWWLITVRFERYSPAQRLNTLRLTTRGAVVIYFAFLVPQYIPGLHFFGGSCFGLYIALLSPAALVLMGVIYGIMLNHTLPGTARRLPSKPIIWIAIILGALLVVTMGLRLATSFTLTFPSSSYTSPFERTIRWIYTLSEISLDLLHILVAFLLTRHACYLHKRASGPSTDPIQTQASPPPPHTLRANRPRKPEETKF